MIHGELVFYSECQRFA